MDEEAERLRLKPGMGIADARAMYPSIEIVAADPQADRRLLEALADWCDRYTPLVAFDGSDGLFLDITGCAHLFGGEQAMLHDIVVRFLHQGFGARAGLASTPGAAWAAARFSTDRTILEDGDEPSFFRGLPLASLRLEPVTVASLESVGLRTVGSVAERPRAPLARRFGAMLLLRLDQALGGIEEVVSPRLPVPPLSVERHLAEPIGLVEDIERLILLLATRLKCNLERRGEGARMLELLLFRVDGAVSRISAGASLPLREPALIGRLFHERLAALQSSLDPGYGFDLVRLSAFATALVETPQADLGGEAGGGGEDIALFADRVRARLGRGAVLEPLLAESHLPERAASLAPAGGSPTERKMPAIPRRKIDFSPSRRAPERPLRLFSRPEPIEVPVTEIPEGPPLNFRWRRAMHRVARAEGPERIAPEWWREEKEAPTRDYFRVEDSDGHRYWLYREGLYEAEGVSPRWYLQGISA
ncbi:DNA polymerase Y family protein [Mesorhizobium sp. KR9-304]|uniref:Y-family DNA polymerase n=1 Tax=Mesorhizobium sp. KR9-304 TaxID=3156614 RepID=UPI0032B528F5